MKSNLRETNIQNLLKFIDREQKSGILYVEIPKNCNSNRDLCAQSNIWQKNLENNKSFSSKKKFLAIAFFAGKITHTFTNESIKLTRLRDYLTYYQLEANIEQYLAENKAKNTVKMTEYNCLIWFLQKGYLKPSQLKSIVRKLTEETIFSIMLRHRSKVFFQVDNRQSPIPTASSSREFIYSLERKLKQWHRFAPHIIQPYQKIQIEKRDYLKNTVSSKTYQYLTSWANEQKSILQLSRQLNCSPVYIAEALYPYAKKGLAILTTN